MNMNLAVTLFLFCYLMLMPLLSPAEALTELPQAQDSAQNSTQASNQNPAEDSSIWQMEYPTLSKEPPSDLAVPLLSLFAPGVNQLYHGQTFAGAAYLSYSILGRLQASAHRSWFKKLEPEKQAEVFDLSSMHERNRQLILGSVMNQFAGEMSLYHSFRSAADARKKNGEYQFFNPKETTGDLLKAPLRFDFLKRKTTWGLLAFEAALLGLSASTVSRKGLTGSDAGYSLTFSYHAGVGEEAVFRGWLMPYLTNQGFSPVQSNLVTSGLFGAMHMSSSNPYPVMQTLLGYYLGQVALWNDWSIQESIFIHTWWDVLAFADNYAQNRAKGDNSIFINLLDIPISL